jgi:hypothetical protein
VFASAQWFAGGKLHVTPAQGSPLHAPAPEHPNAQDWVFSGYEHVPDEQFPGFEK